MLFICLCAGFIWLPPLQHLSELIGIGMLTIALVQLQDFFHSLVHLAPFIRYSTRLMLHPQGRSCRGSPWKPHRPSVFPLASPSSRSSPSIQPEPILPLPPAIVVSQFDSLAIVPRLSSSSSRLLPNPPLFEPPPATIPNSTGKTVGEAPPCEPQNTEN
jgi:hypothetical protein